MDPSPDELAGVVDLLGGLTRAELVAALEDLAARAGEPVDADAVAATIDAALQRYYLLEVPDPGGADAELLLPGPAALPTLPEGGEDLPHLRDREPRAVDPSVAAAAAEGRLRADAARAIDEGDVGRASLLLDACYEVEAWGPVDLDDAKAGLADLVE